MLHTHKQVFTHGTFPTEVVVTVNDRLPRSRVKRLLIHFKFLGIYCVGTVTVQETGHEQRRTRDKKVLVLGLTLLR